jgi:hypothetical protein
MFITALLVEINHEHRGSTMQLTPTMLCIINTANILDSVCHISV